MSTDTVHTSDIRPLSLPIGDGRKLNADLEFLIIKAVCDGEPSRSSDLSALSLACREFYAVVAPRRWLHVRWPKVKAARREVVGHKSEKILDPLPTAILGLIRYDDTPLSTVPRVHTPHKTCCSRHLYLFHEGGILSSVEHSEASWLSLTKSLTNMSNLEAVAFNLPAPPPVSFLDALYVLPNLTTFESFSTPLHFQLTTLYPESIRRLVLQRPIEGLNIDTLATRICLFTGFTSDPTTYLPRDNHVRHQIGRSLWSSRSGEHCLFTHAIVCATLGSLNHLELDIELFDFDVLGEARFPHLITLIFHGTSPDSSSSYSLLKLKGMRTLREMSFALSAPSNSPSDFHILPSLPDPHSLQATADIISELFPELQVFRTSNPSPNDAIYYALPSTVRGIHFKSIVPVRGGTGALDKAGLVKILETLEVGRRRTITDFSAILQVALLPALLSSIVGKLPDLETLQIKAPFVEGESALFSVVR